MKEEFISLPLQLEVPQNDGEFRLGMMFRESLEQDRGMLFIFENTDYHSFHMKNTFIPLDIAFINEEGIIESIKELNPMNPIPVYPDGEIRYAIEVNRGWFAENGVVVGDAILEEGCQECGESCDNCECECHNTVSEAKDRKGKGSGTKDACYHKVKSRYSVWPSAYASGALVKCRKVGAANWGNSRKEEVEYETKVYKTPHYRWRDEIVEHHRKDEDGNTIPHEDELTEGKGKLLVKGLKLLRKSKIGKKLGAIDKLGQKAAVAAGGIGVGVGGGKLMYDTFKKKDVSVGISTNMEEFSDWRQELDEKCWPGYEKKGMKTMFGKRYPNCVKKSKSKPRKEELDYDEMIEGAADVLVKTATGGKKPKDTGVRSKSQLDKIRAVYVGASYQPEGKLVDEGMAGALVKGGSKLIPALMTGIGAAGTIMQAKKINPMDFGKSKRSKKEKKAARSQKQRVNAIYNTKKGVELGNELQGDAYLKNLKKKSDDVTEEKKMTKKQMKKRDEIADAIGKKDMKKRYGDENVRYAIATKLAMKEDITDEALTIQDWNVDDIKFTEIETVDVIKAKPLKESKAKLAIGTAKFTQKLFKTMGRAMKSGNRNPLTGNVFAKPGSVKFSRTFAPMDVGAGARVKSQKQLNTFIQGAKENIRTGKGIPAPIKTKFRDTKKGTELFADKRGINTLPPNPTGEKLKKIRLSTPVKKVRSFDKQMDRYTMGTYKPLMGAAFGASAYQGITGKDPIQQIGDKIQEPARKKQIEKQNKALDDLYNKMEKEKKEKKVKKLDEGYKTKLIKSAFKKVGKLIKKAVNRPKTGRGTYKMSNQLDIFTGKPSLVKNKATYKKPVQKITDKVVKNKPLDTSDLPLLKSTPDGLTKSNSGLRKGSIVSKTKSQNIQTQRDKNIAKKIANQGKIEKKFKKGNTPVKVNLKKKIDFDKYFSGEGSTKSGRSTELGKNINPKLKGDQSIKVNLQDLQNKMKDPKRKIEKKINKKNMKDHYDWRNQLDDDVLYRLGEDWQKVNRKDKTDGLSKKAVKAYRRENPGSKLKTAVTKDPKKLKKGSKDAKRRLSFCRRMKGMKKRLTSAKTARDPDSRINKALRRWNC